MDLGFLRRAEARFASRAAAHPDFGMLLAALRAQQAGSPAVQALGRVGSAAGIADPLVEILLCGPRWREARVGQRGVFNARYSRQRTVNRGESEIYRPVSAFLQRGEVEAAAGRQ